MEVLRTPETRFENLEGWPYAPRYQEVSARDGSRLRFHYVDEGPRDAAPVLLLHGNPSWSYLHREMIGGLASLGHRVVALDLMGLGRSDKPAAADDYTLDTHVAWMGQWLEALDLRDLTLYCQDWGGLTGLHLLPLFEDRFLRVVASNTGIPEGEGMSPFMKQWLQYSQSLPMLPVAELIAAGTATGLSDAAKRAYDAPYPEAALQAGVRKFPLLIPVQPENPGVPRCKALWKYLETWEKPFLTAFGALDPVATKSGAHLRFQERVPGAKGQPHVIYEKANHFLQEDVPRELVTLLDAFVRATPA